MKILNENLKFKILSVFLALFLWFYVTEIQTTTTTRTIDDVPISIVNKEVLEEKGLSFVELDNYVTSIKVKGTKEVIRKLVPDDFEVTVDVSNISEVGKSNVSLRVNMVNFSNMELLALNPSRLEFDVEEYITVDKQIKVEVDDNSENTLSEYTYDVDSVNPEGIKISGPKSLVGNVSDVVVNLNVDDISGDDIVTFCNFNIIDSLGSNITTDKNLKFNNIQVQLEATKLKAKAVPVEIMIVGEVANGYTIKSKHINGNAQVLIVGKESDIQGIESVVTEPIVVSGLNSTQEYELSLQVGDVIKHVYSVSDKNTIVDKVKATLEIVEVES